MMRTDEHIWPTRIIRIASPWDSGHSVPWLNDEKITQIREIVAKAHGDMLDKPAMLDESAVRLIALGYMGVDGLSESRMLLVRVTDERFTERAPCIRLSVISYGPIEDSDLPQQLHILPGQAADILKRIIEQFCAVRGLIRPESELRR